MLYSLLTLNFSSNLMRWFEVCCATVGTACNAKTTNAENTATVRMRGVVQMVSSFCFLFMFSPNLNVPAITAVARAGKRPNAQSIRMDFPAAQKYAESNMISRGVYVIPP